MKYLQIMSLSCLFLCTMFSNEGFAQGSRAASSQRSQAWRDGQHDFDFNIGVWRTHYRRLLHPLAGSNDWIEFDGTVSVRKVWGGRAQLEEIEADGPMGHWEGLTLFLYNPRAHQWSQYFANSSTGVLDRPEIGEFKDEQGEFFDQERFNGRAILVRLVWSDITQNSHRLEQSFSDDGGKTWETNFIATMVRKSNEAAIPRASTKPFASDEHAPVKATALMSSNVALADASHDFDFNFGIWKTHITRLEHPLTGSTTWQEYAGTSNVSPVWGGRADLFELEAAGSAGHIEGLGLRLYNPKSHQWSLNWANSTDGIMTTPMIGTFADGFGRFFDQEEFQGEFILSRNTFSAIKPNSSRFEQAFSIDGGTNWETNWIMTFSR